MSGWVKVPAEWFERDDVEQLGAEVVMLHLSALAYSARQLTNGVVSRRQLRRLWPVDDLDAAADRLVSAGFWQATDDGFLIVDWRTFILAADEVASIREQSRITTERHRRHKADDHSMCDRCSAVRAGRNGVRDASRDASVTTSVTPPPNRTEPNRPLGREGGSEVGAGARSAGATRPPRLVVGDEATPLADPTPWDMQVFRLDLDPDDYGHEDITARPVLDRGGTDAWSVDDLDAGYEHFRRLALTVAAGLAEAVAAVRARHGCHGKRDADGMPDECGLSTDDLDDAEPVLSVDVPRALADAWLDRIANAFRAAKLADTVRPVERTASS